MTFTVNAPMLDFLVLSVIAKGDAYGYQISQILKPVSTAKDSTLYPILRRLQENQWVEAYDQPYQGRNRRYYRITPEGTKYQQELVLQWQDFIGEIEKILDGGNKE